MLYKLSKDTDLSFLVKRELIQVAIGFHQVIFNFDGTVTVSISAEDGFEVVSDSVTQTWEPRRPLTADAALGLLGQTVERVEISTNSEVNLLFSTGMQLVILTSEAPYESYQITYGTSLIVV